MGRITALLVLSLILLPVSVYSGEIHEAAKNGDLVKLKELLDKDPSLIYVQDEQGKTPLHWATGRYQSEAMKLMLDTYHADVNVRNKNQGTPLHVAASQANPEGVKILIEHKADIEARTKDGATPLHIAALKGKKAGHIETVRILLEHGANPNAQDNMGGTPIMYARRRNNTVIIKLLRQYEAKESSQQVASPVSSEAE
jgi:cytohesin